MWAFYGNFWAKGDHLMETSCLKAHHLGTVTPSGRPLSSWTLVSGGGIPSKKATIINIIFCLLLDLLHLQKLMWRLK